MLNVLPLVSAATVAEHNKKSDCWVSLYHRKVYDVTLFLDEHPGGTDIILPYAGKDVTAIMSDTVSHYHSENAYEMLDEAMLIGYLATAEEEAELVNNKNSVPVEVKLTKEAEEQFDLSQFHSRLPALEKLTVQTEFSLDAKKHEFLDLNKPLLPQMFSGRISKELYMEQVHRPRHYGKGSAPLFGNFLEPLTLTPWWVVPLIWVPFNFTFFYIGFMGQSRITALSLWALGLFAWTFVEYCLHRFLFHLDYFLPDNRVFLTLHFFVHGIHHYLPMDRDRLVLPPPLVAALVYPVYKLMFSYVPFYMACSAFSGITLGYIFYDMIHFVLHHNQVPSFIQWLKTYHLEHHYKNYEMGFGVTNKFWDIVFDTEIVTKKE